MERFDVVLSSKAQSDLSECVGFVLNVSKQAALALADDIYAAIGTLSTFPERSPLFSMPKSFPYSVRKLVINGRYVALYAVEGSKVVVYRILDTRRRFDFLLF